MKRNIILTAILSILCLPVIAATYYPTFECNPSMITVENDGGTFYISIKQVPRKDNDRCYIYDIGDDLTVEDSDNMMKSFRKTTHNNLVLEFKPRNTAKTISGKIKLRCTMNKTDALDFILTGPDDGKIEIGDGDIGGGSDSDTDTPASVAVCNIEIQYNYFGIMYLYPGMIEASNEIYVEGDQPKQITSVAPAVCGRCNDVVTYVWEKKYPDTDWVEMTDRTGEECVPDIMGTQSVQYRRKAICHGDPKYSNIVEIKAVLSAGEIGLEYTDTSSDIYLTNVRDPSVANSQLSWESSTDMDNWTKIASGSLTRQVNRPSVTTYYRRSASTLDGKTVRYSNIVCFNLENPVYISKQLSTDKLGRSCVEDIMYYDGLGRPILSVGVDAAAPDTDVITLFTYDGNGRQDYDRLSFPALANGGTFARNAEYKSDTYYKSLYKKTSSVYPYARTEYDGSPLDRVSKTFRPGAEYQADSLRFVSYSYALNGTNEVLRLSVNDLNELSVDGYYPANELYKNTVTDEDGNYRITFTDTYGHTILSRGWTQANGNIDTYYVYDRCDRLRWVISPEGSAQLAPQSGMSAVGSDFAKKYCYRYAYGANGKICEKYLPGQDRPERLHYDEYDRVDSLFTANSDRVSYSYEYDNLGRLLHIRANVADNRLLPLKTSFVGEPQITAGTFDITEYKYDEYDYSGDFDGHEFVAIDGVVCDSDKYDNALGRKTQEKIYEAFSLTGKRSDYRCRTHYYDVRNRIIQTVETDSRGNMLRTGYRYDYIGNILTRDERYAVGDDDTDVRYDYTYDSRGRLIAENVSIDGQPQTSVENTYDYVGRLKKTVSGDNLQTVYDYNIQGWLTKKDIDRKIEFILQPLALEHTSVLFDKLFEEQLRYFAPTYAEPSYSGNIAEIQWSRNGNGKYQYSFTYDELGRLSNSDYKTKNDLSVIDNIYGERNIVYDRNGNITHFERGSGTSTLYKYDRTFSGNRMTASAMQTETNNGLVTEVSDPVSTAFGYDSMGNITSMTGEDNLEIAYNFLNLPRKVVRSTYERDRFGQMKLRKETTTYLYLSDGTKVSSCDADGDGYMYFGSARFSLNNNVPTLESIPFSGGRIVKTTNGYEPQYYLTDHLGSTRAVVNKDGQTVEATFDYTPFGVECASASTPTNATEYRFSGKELQNITDHEIYDFGARQYFAKYGIWGQPDPLAEKYYPVSPYAYCLNNPIKFIDPDGNKLVTFINDKQYVVLWNTDPKKGNVGWTSIGKSNRYAILRRHLKELQKTVTGKQQFDKLVTSNLPIAITYGRLDGGEYGITTTKHGENTKKQSSVIIKIDTENNKAKASDNGVTLDQAIASTLGHEIRHTEDENFKMQTTTPKSVEYQYRPEEIDAHKIGNEIIQDYKNGNYYKEERTNFMGSIIDCFNKLFK